MLVGVLVSVIFGTTGLDSVTGLDNVGKSAMFCLVRFTGFLGHLAGS